MLNMELRMYFKSSLVFVLLVFVYSCKKSEDRTCFKKWGKDSTREVSLPAFDKLEVYEQIEVVLIQDSSNRLVIIGGENVVNFVEFEVDSDKKLVLRNKNKCNFLRSYDKKIKVEIHFTELINVYFEGTEPMYSKDTLTSDYFTLFVRDGAGSIDLTLKSKVINAEVAHGWGDYTLKGKTDYARIAAKSNGFCNTYGLDVSDSLFVFCQTSSIMKVRADQIPMRVTMINNGIVEYKGIPSSINFQQFGTGQIINAN